MNDANVKITIGATSYLREDYENKNVSEKFNIPCEIEDLKYPQILQAERNIKEYTGKIVKIKRDDREEAEWVTIDSLKH